MDTYQCTADTLNIRTGPGTAYAPSGVYLKLDDKINGIKNSTNWISIDKIIRVNGNELLPPFGIQWWCSGAYVKLVSSTPTPNPTPASTDIQVSVTATLEGYIPVTMFGVLKKNA